MPGGFTGGSGGSGGCLLFLLFLFTGFGAIVAWIWLTVRSLVGAFTKGPRREVWRVVLALCLAAAVVFLAWWWKR